ncbi:hypothetical protein SAMN04487980_104019 [Streptomyces sp. cf124]|uniref:hypothetical protein n=1 Tax=Streptomyces sp. cf124 TaxID=1761903 RepID=UPI0008E2793A|nr:hypothetical protein [Streptomyces sp. cf124]SFN95619.1 hypothetical protein SAMN04487980_104019 [Streptomyces sp. cf124]
MTSPHTQQTAAAPGAGHGRSATRSLMHRDHPWIGREVDDTTTGHRGILRAIAPDTDRPLPVAWLLPAGGGTEWTTDPGALANPAPLTPDTHPGQTP